MIIIDCQQGADEWKQARLGKPTASQFHRILTPKTLKVSSQAHGYMCELIAERLLKVPLDDGTSDWMQRGTILEDAARRYYELQQDVDVQSVGFCTTDDGRIGCSPDGLVGNDGGIEIKCPNAANQVSHMLDPMFTDEYRMQVQGSLWICEREWWDVVSFNPYIPSKISRVYRDDEVILPLSGAVDEFCRSLEVGYERIKQELPDIDSLIAEFGNMMRGAG